MIRRILTVFTLYILAFSAGATHFVPGSLSEASIPTSAATDTSRLVNALLWKVTHPDLQSTSYVFGTIHLISRDDYFLPAGTQLALEASDRIVFEIDMKEMTDMGAMLSIMMKAFMNNGTRLQDLISAEDYQLVEKHFSGLGLPMFMLDRIKPLFLTVFASSEIGPDALQSGEMTSYEMEFYDFAVQGDKATGGLETIDFQISVFDSIPYKAQAEMLVESIRAEEEQNDVFQHMVDLYLTQDIEALYAILDDDDTGVGDFGDVLVINRNTRWIDGMRDYMKEGNVFFAVGAGHLGGTQGVIRLLQAEGFSVTPVLEPGDRQMKKF